MKKSTIYPSAKDFLCGGKMRNIKNTLVINAILFLFSLVLFLPCDVHAAEEFAKGEDGAYHITSVNDWNTFLDKMQGSAETYSGNTIVLDTDLEIDGRIADASAILFGNFDGNGHTIYYTYNDLYAFSSVFPFYLYGGTIKNVNVCLKDCQIDASKHNGSVDASVLVVNGFNSCAIENVNLYGEITVKPDPNHTNDIRCSGIALSNSLVNNCTVNISYHFTNDIFEQFINNTSEYNLKIKLYQFGNFSTQKTAFSNCYSLGTYSSSFNSYGTVIENYYNNKSNNQTDEYIAITPFGGRTNISNSPSFENCYYNSEESPLYLIGSDSAKEAAASCYTNEEDMQKSTEDLKKQETFVDYDFENVWGISDYINEGYPYLRALVSKDLVELVDQIAALPKDEALTKDDKAIVDKLKELLGGLSDKDKALIDVAALSDKVDKAEQAIEALDNKDKADDSTQNQEASTKKDSAVTPAATKISLKKGTKFTVKGYKFKVTGVSVKNPTASVTGYKNKKLKKITVPATVTYKKVKFRVTAVANNAFKNQKKAKSVVIGKNVTAIGKAAFYGDAKVKKITVKSASLKKVGAKAFKGIHKKAVIKVPAKKLSAYKKMMKKKGQAKTVKIRK